MKSISFEQTKNPEAIEKLFCMEFEKLQQHPISDEEMRSLINLCFIEASEFKIAEEAKPFLVKMIESRIKQCFTFTYGDDLRLPFFIAILTKTPGKAVMLLWYIQYWAFKNNIREITFNLFGKEIIPKGFYNEEDLNKMLDSQKVHSDDGTWKSDNLLDYSEAGMSIQFK